MKERIVYRFIVFLNKFGRIGKRISFKLMMFNTDRFHSLLYRKFILDKYKISLGIGSYGLDTTIFDGPAIIGKYVSIGPNVRRLCVNHPTTGITTHPCCFNPIYKWIMKDPRNYTKLNVGNDVWIGASVIILPSVKNIGNGAVIAAGSIVTKDVPSYHIVGGNPAKIIKKRFNDELINQLENSKWWDAPEEVLKELVQYMNSPDVFLEKFNQVMNR